MLIHKQFEWYAGYIRVSIINNNPDVFVREYPLGEYMTRQLLFLLFFSLGCEFAYSAECALPLQERIELTKFTADQRLMSPSATELPRMDDNKCFPQSKSAIVIGKPICNLGNSVPVNMVVGSAIDTSGIVEVVMYALRGTKPDYDFALSYFGKYEDITDYYLKNIKGPKFYGTTHAWKSGNQYIVLGEHEPGYDPVEISLHLLVGTKQGIEFVGVDLNTCK